MAVRALTVADLDWAVGVLTLRRAALTPHAPVFWRPAEDARTAHHAFLAHVITDAGGLGFRTADALLVAAPGRTGWAIDDAFVPDGQWNVVGRELWNAFAETSAGDSARFVCPVHEAERAHFAGALGLTIADSWWHLEVPQEAAPATQRDPDVAGATARLVPAPPIYDPGGPILFLPEVTDPSLALPSAPREAMKHGCPLVVVNQPSDHGELGRALAAANFRHHCDFFDGTI